MLFRSRLVYFVYSLKVDYLCADCNLGCFVEPIELISLYWLMLVIKVLIPFAFIIAANYDGNRFITKQDGIWKVSHPITVLTFPILIFLVTSYVV